MLKRSHALLGATAGIAVAQATGEPMITGALIGAVAGLLPDIDSPGSALGRYLPRWWHRLTPGHRGPTHSSFWSEPLALLAMAGVASHICSDAITEAGVPWIWPLSKQRLALPHWLAIRTGGWAEGLVVVGVIVVAVFVLAGCAQRPQPQLQGGKSEAWHQVMNADLTKLCEKIRLADEISADLPVDRKGWAAWDAVIRYRDGLAREYNTDMAEVRQVLQGGTYGLPGHIGKHGYMPDCDGSP